MSISLGTVDTVADKSFGMYPDDDGEPFVTNDVSTSITYSNTGGSYYGLGYMHVLCKLYGTYKNSEVGYTMTKKIYAYMEKGTNYDTYKSKIYVKFSDNNFYIDGSVSGTVKNAYNYNYVTLSNISTSSSSPTLIAVSSDDSSTPGTGTKVKTYKASTFFYAAESSSGTAAVYKKMTTGNYNITYQPHQFECTFDLGSYAESPPDYFVTPLTVGYNANTPSYGLPKSVKQPSERTITCTYKPKGDQADTPISAKVQDVRSATGWSPSLPAVIKSKKTFTMGYSVSYATTNLKLPDFTPTKTGYTFKNWVIGETNIGSTPGATAEYTFGTDGEDTYTAKAVYESDTRNYKVLYYTMNNGVLEKIADSSGKYGEEIAVKYDATATVNIPSILGYTKPSSVYYTDSTGTLQYVSSISGTIADGTEFIALYTITNYTITLKLNGGAIEGKTSNIVINYNILSGEPDEYHEGKKTINIRSLYQPEVENATFVGWVDDAKGTYTEVVIPVEQIAGTNKNPKYTAEYMLIGKFVYHNKSWRGIVNAWIYRNGKWQGQASTKVGLLETTTVTYIYKDGKWNIEKGKTDTALD